MRPVHESTQLIPFVQPPERDPVANGDRNPCRQVEVVRNKQRAALADLDDEPLVP